MSTTKLLETMNSLASTKFTRESWSAVVPQLVAITLSKKGLVSDGIILLESFNKRACYFYYNQLTHQYSLGHEGRRS